MRNLNVIEISKTDSKILARACLVAVLIEASLLTAIGFQQHWLAHPQKIKGLDASKFIEAEVFQLPKDAHLVEEKKIAAPQTKEVTISKKIQEGKKTSAEETKPAEEDKNVTESGPPMAPTHGPVAVVAPVPVIPAYLRDQNISASVVIEFWVNMHGTAVPRLIGSSGNEELDALALASANKWVFRPAEQDHKPIESKVRLRINFKVE